MAKMNDLNKLLDAAAGKVTSGDEVPAGFFLGRLRLSTATRIRGNKYRRDERGEILVSKDGRAKVAAWDFVSLDADVVVGDAIEMHQASLTTAAWNEIAGSCRAFSDVRTLGRLHLPKEGDKDYYVVRPYYQGQTEYVRGRYGDVAVVSGLGEPGKGTLPKFEELETRESFEVPEELEASGLTETESKDDGSTAEGAVMGA